MTNCPLCEAVTGQFCRPIARYANTFIDYQGLLLCEASVPVPDLKALDAGGPK